MNTPWVFTAQIIEEDGETEPQPPPEKPIDNEVNHVKQVNPPRDQPADPNGSQYESTQEGFPLDEYEEYVKILNDHKNNDEDVIYICTVCIEENIEDNDSKADTPAIRAINIPEKNTDTDWVDQ